MTDPRLIADPPDVPGRPDRGRRPFAVPQYVVIALGLWLVASTFVWPHTAASRINTWILGIVIIVVAASAVVRPVLHRLNAAAAVWLIVSTLIIHHVTSGTAWDNAVVGLLVLGYAVSTEEEGPARPRRWFRHL
jgi:hypothetical protein